MRGVPLQRAEPSPMAIVKSRVQSRDPEPPRPITQASTACPSSGVSSRSPCVLPLPVPESTLLNQAQPARNAETIK